MGDFAAAIFDLDGTLLDSMRVWERIDFDFLTKRGIPIPDDYAATVAPLSFRQTARYTIDRFSLRETEDEIMSEWQDMARREYAWNVRLKAHAAEYLVLLKESGVKLATATSLHSELAESALRGNGILDLFDALCSTDEAGRGKEFPDVFMLAARRSSSPSDRCRNQC
jgi:beta-phosphoglucomutase-like phosphatase (HAD superfamily)